MIRKGVCRPVAAVIFILPYYIMERVFSRLAIEVYILLEEVIID